MTEKPCSIELLIRRKQGESVVLLFLFFLIVWVGDLGEWFEGKK